MSQKQNKSKTDSKQCLVCKNSTKTLRKGLCPSHYAQYVRAREQASSKGLDVDQFDADLIAAGLLAEDARQANNPFATALAKFEAKQEAKLHVAEAEAQLYERRKEK